MKVRRIILAAAGLAAFVACADNPGVNEVRKAPNDGASLAKVASVTVTLASPSIAVGKTTQATAKVIDIYGEVGTHTVTWTSSNTAVATVSSSGLVTGINVGSATISGTAGNYTKVTGSTTVTVTSGSTTTAPGAVTNLSASPTNGTTVTLSFTQVSNGQGAPASYDVRFANPPISWGSAASVASGTCTTPFVGTATSGTITCTVTGLQPSTPYAFQLVSYRGTLNAGATFGPLSNIASATTPTSSTTPIPVATVIVTANSTSILASQQTQASAVLRDANGNVLTGRTITWSSTNTAVATVNSSGLVTGGSTAGTASIRATSEGQTGSVNITVGSAPAPTPAPVATVGVTLSSSSILAGQQTQATATLRDANNNVLTGRTVTWSSTNNAVATVNSSGVVTGVAAGTATVGATSEGKTGSANVTVTVAATTPPPSGGSAPEPSASSTILHQDVFDRSDAGSGYAKNPGIDYQTIAGRSGNAARFIYSSKSGDNVFEKAFSQSTDIYFRYWYRASPGADPTCGGKGPSGFKWFMAWRPGSEPRYTMGVSRLAGAPLNFSSHDNSSSSQPNPFPSNLNTNITFGSTADGQWHKYTLHIKTGSGGYEQIWIDGVKVLDNQGMGYDHSSTGVSYVKFPGNIVQFYSGCDFTVDIDDLVFWR